MEKYIYLFIKINQIEMVLVKTKIEPFFSFRENYLTGGSKDLFEWKRITLIFIIFY